MSTYERKLLWRIFNAAAGSSLSDLELYNLLIEKLVDRGYDRMVARRVVKAFWNS